MIHLALTQDFRGLGLYMPPHMHAYMQLFSSLQGNEEFSKIL